MNGQKYWIWLSAAIGQGARTDEILAAYPDPAVIYEDDRRRRLLSGVFTKAKLDKLESVKLSDAENALEVCRKNGWKVYTPADEGYPSQLKKLVNMPLVLFVNGDISCLEGRLVVSIVGTRNPTYESTKIARKLAGDMAQSGVTVVSGGALGIDSAAHEGAMASGGQTVCVLGCGLGANYLSTNEVMRREIAKNGAVITEYPPLQGASRSTFPIRNRIISGVSHGVLVVEAGEKSGSLITASCAAEQGKDVFAVPGSILSTAYTGANKLIRDGAGAITCADDIIRPLSAIYDFKPVQAPAEAKEKPRSVPSSLKGDALTVYKALGKEPLHPDEICAVCGLSPQKVMTALMELELSGYAEQAEGRNYILT